MFVLTQLGRDKFHKSHAFDYNGDVYNFVGEHKSGIGQAPLAIANSIHYCIRWSATARWKA